MTREIMLITGVMAAGKSTIAQRLAERLPLSVHLRGDVFRRMIVNGQEEISPDNWDETAKQLHLRYRLSAQAAIAYAEAGFTVIYQDVVLGSDLGYVAGLIAPGGMPFSVVVLAPSAEVAAQRDRERNKSGYGDWTAEDLDAGLRRDTPRLGLWLDTSHLTADETVDAIMERCAEARIVPGPVVD